MPLLEQVNPIHLVVGRELALREGADTPAALRHALVGSMLAEGIVGVIVARQLAIREAPAAPTPTVRPAESRPPDAVGPDALIENSLRGFRQAHQGIRAASTRIDLLKKQQADAENEIDATKERVTELCKEQKDHVKSLFQQISSRCDPVWTLQVFDEIAKSKGIDLRDICKEAGQTGGSAQQGQQPPQPQVSDGNNDADGGAGSCT